MNESVKILLESRLNLLEFMNGLLDWANILLQMVLMGVNIVIQCLKDGSESKPCPPNGSPGVTSLFHMKLLGIIPFKMDGLTA